MKKITLLITSFNSLSQIVYVWLKESGFLVDVVFATSIARDKEIESFRPDLILCPFLKHYIPKNIWQKYPTFVFHPGIIGDRGAYSIENLILDEKKEWGGVWLRADDEFDSGDIYASDTFSVTRAKKSYIYRVDEFNLAVKLLPTLLSNIENDLKIPQIKNGLNTKPDLHIDWQKDTTDEIIKKIDTLDSFPGIADEILGIEVELFGVFKEDKLRCNTPKKILAKRDGAICLSTTDGAIWITHLKERGKFKLPSTYVLKDRLKGVQESRLPLIFDKSYNTFFEISCSIDGEIGYLSFNFHNGAFRAEQCMRLKYAIEYLRENLKVIVLMGGDEFFSNGINLNILQDSKKSGEDGWSNINAINDLIKSIIFADDVITVASLQRNAGAGGVFLATACDYVVMDKNVVLNPHYKTIGLSGSEYHTFSLPKRVGEDEANKLLHKCLPIGAKYAKKIGLADEVFEDDYEKRLKEFCTSLVDDDFFDEYIWQKQDFLEENIDLIESCREKEIEIMHPEFWEDESEFHLLRYQFVYKVCQNNTPKRLKWYNC